MDSQWIPRRLDLLRGNPFQYSEHSVSVISATEAFQTGIGARDGQRCVVCGASSRQSLEHAHIIPKVEYDTVRYALLYYYIRN